MNRRRDNDTQPMLVPPVTQTDAGARPVPELDSLTPTPEEDAREIESIMEAFDRPAQAPVQIPVNRANSDGADFVAYNTSSVPRARTPEEARQLALVEIASIAAEPDPHPPLSPLDANRHEPTALVTRRRGLRFRNVRLIVSGVALVGVGCVIGAVVAVRVAARAPADIAVPAERSGSAAAAAPPPAALVASSAERSAAVLPLPPTAMPLLAPSIPVPPASAESSPAVAPKPAGPKANPVTPTRPPRAAAPQPVIQHETTY